MKISQLTDSVSNLNLNALNGSDNRSVVHDGSNQPSVSFSSMLKESIDQLNNSQVNAYNAMEDIATGKVENLQEAVQKIEEAELSLKLGLEVKNKALGAYKQVMSMQV